MPEAHGHGHEQFVPGIIGCFNVAVRGREEESMNRAEYICKDEVMKAITEEYNRKGTNDGLKLAWIEKAVNSVPAWIPIEKEFPPDDDHSDKLKRAVEDMQVDIKMIQHMRRV